MGPNRRDHLLRLDAALLALRRVTNMPPSRAELEHEGDQVEVSTMLVVDAIARTRADAGCSVGHVAEVLTVAHSTASRLVDRAVRAGVVTRSRDTREGRRALLQLTPAGSRLQAASTQFRTLRLGAVTTDWSASDVATLTTLLERFARDARPHLSGHLRLEKDPR